MELLEVTGHREKMRNMQLREGSAQRFCPDQIVASGQMHRPSLKKNQTSSVVVPSTGRCLEPLDLA